MTLFEPGEPDRKSTYSKTLAERRTGIAYVLAAVAFGFGVIYLMSFIMGD